MSPHRASNPAVHLTLRWRHDVIAVRRVGPEGVAVGALAPIPCPPGLTPFVFARQDGALASAFAPDGGVATLFRDDGGVEIIEGPAEIPLASGDVAELVVGDFVLAASAGPAEALPRARRRAAALWGLALAAMAHAVVFGLAAQDARASSVDAADERAEVLRGLLASAELRARAGDFAVIEDGSGKGEGQDQNHKRGDGRAGGGERAAGDEGKMGDRLASARDRRRYAVPAENKKDASPETARAAAMTDAAAFGMIGLLGQGPNVPVAAFADPWAHGADALAARGSMWASVAGESAGEGGLGLTGIGEGGGSDGAGIGLGHIGTLGHADRNAGPGTGGAGSPLSFRSAWDSFGGLGRHVSLAPRCRAYCCGCSVSGRLPPEAVQRIVRQNFGRFRACYESALSRNPTLSGTVKARFVIGRNGAVSNVGNGGSSMPDEGVVSCVIRSFYGIAFPEPEGGIVTVTYPIAFSPE